MGVLSAELLMERRVQSAFDLVKPDLHKRVEQGKEYQKVTCDQQAVIHSFKVEDPTYARNYGPGVMWAPACVTKVIGPQRYRIKRLNEDELCYCHVEDDDIQRVEITDSIRTSSIAGESPLIFLHHEL